VIPSGQVPLTALLLLLLLSFVLMLVLHRRWQHLYLRSKRPHRHTR
jgi:hypothetical protein